MKLVFAISNPPYRTNFYPFSAPSKEAAEKEFAELSYKTEREYAVYLKKNEEWKKDRLNNVMPPIRGLTFNFHGTSFFAGNKAPEFFTLDEWFDKFKSD